MSTRKLERIVIILSLWGKKFTTNICLSCRGMLWMMRIGRRCLCHDFWCCGFLSRWQFLLTLKKHVMQSCCQNALLNKLKMREIIARVNRLELLTSKCLSWNFHTTINTAHCISTMRHFQSWNGSGVQSWKGSES